MNFDAKLYLLYFMGLVAFGFATSFGIWSLFKNKNY